MPRIECRCGKKLLVRTAPGRTTVRCSECGQSVELPRSLSKPQAFEQHPTNVQSATPVAEPAAPIATPAPSIEVPKPPTLPHADSSAQASPSRQRSAISWAIIGAIIGITATTVGVVVALIILQGTSSPAGSEIGVARLTRQYEPMTFTVRRINADISGTGLLVSNDLSHGLVITNQHVVDDAEMVALKPANIESVHFGQVVAIHAEFDLALVQLTHPFPKHRAVQIASLLMIQQGESATAFGSPHQIEFMTVPGVISRLEQSGKILHSCELDHGNSGGPLVLNRGGYVAGINVAIAERTLNIAEPAEAILGRRDGTKLETSRFEYTNDVWVWKIDGVDRQQAIRLLDKIELVKN